MAKYKLIVFSDGLPGREDEYNDWYNNVHLQDVVAIPGMVAAERYKLELPMIGEFQNKYLAIYEVETDDPAKMLEVLGSRAGTDQMVVSDAIDMGGTAAGLFKVCSDRVVSPNKAAAEA